MPTPPRRTAPEPCASRWAPCYSCPPDPTRIAIRLALLAALLALPALAASTAAADSHIGIDRSDSTSDERIVVGSGEQVLGTSATGPATGIWTGTGDDSIDNQGEVRADSDVEDGDADADATGIRTEAGEDTVANDGLVEAEASATSGDGDIDVGIEDGAQADASMTADATATGIDAGSDADTVTGDGDVTASAEASAGSGNISVSIGQGATGDAASTAVANATGIRADEGTDEIESGGALRATAAASAGSGTISVAGSQDASIDVSSRADASSAGIDGGAGRDVVTNAAEISADAESTSVAGSISLSVPPQNGATPEDPTSARAEAGSAATADAVGIAGEQATTSGGISAGARATSVGGAVAGNLDGDAAGGAKSSADATATGIAGSDGVDSITVEAEAGSVSASAQADSVAGSIAGSVSGDASADADSSATASAKAIDSGAGADGITNRAAIVADADATSAAGSLGVGGSSGQQPPDGNGEPTTVQGGADSSASASAAGIEGGSVTTLGPVAASAGATSVGGSLAGNLDGDAEGSARSSADATTTGIGGSSADDTIVIEDVAGVVSATAQADSVGGSIAGGLDGSASGEVESSAMATAKAVDGGEGTDTVTNRAAIVAQADAVSVAGAVGVSGSSDEQPGDPQPGEAGGAEEHDTNTAEGGAASSAIALSSGIEGSSVTTLGGVVSGVSSTSVGGSIAANLDGDAEGTASSTADATAHAIGGSEGSDTVTIERSAGSLVAAAKADSVAGSIAGGVDGSASGEAVSAANATARGVGADTVTNRAAIVVGAEAVSVAGALGVSLPGEETPTNQPGVLQPSEEDDATDDATAKGGAESTATAETVGIEGRDITNLGAVSADADATSVGGSLAGNLGGSAEGDARSSASATATAILGSDATDTIRIEASAGTVEAIAAADSVAGTIAGGRGGDASGEASSTANATAKAVDSREGAEIVENEASIVADAHATSGSGAVGVSIPEDDGSGTDPEPPDEEEEPSSAKGKAESTATAVAAGIEGGGAHNRGDITVRAEAESGGGSIGANLDGGAEGSAASTADARSAGIAGSANAETIESSGGEIRSDAHATSGAATIAAGVGGEAAGDASSTATADARGIDAGAGADVLTGDSAIHASADAGSGAGTLSATVPSPDDQQAATSPLPGELPEALDDYVSNVKGSAASTANATAVGIGGGDGDDRVDTGGSIEAEADATSVAVSLTVNVSKIEENAAAVGTLADASSTAEASATGIDGGAGDDTVDHDGSIVADAESEVVAVAASLGVTVGEGKLAGGGSLADADVTARATATGLQGGEGNDELSHTGGIEARADAAATAVAASLQVTKLEKAQGVSGALATSTTSAASEAVGMDAGSVAEPAPGEKLRLTNSGDIHSGATADGVGVAVSVDVTVDTDGGVSLGGSMADSTVTSQATASGIRGSDAAEEIENTGDTILHADADATAVSVAASVGVSTGKGGSLSAGAALADATATAEARVSGLAGAGGDDLVDNMGSITTGSEGSADLPPFLVLDPPGPDDDRILSVPGCGDESAGVCASSGATSVAVRAQVVKQGATLGASLSDTTSRATAAAVGLDGGAGSDVVTNEGDISLHGVRSDAHAVSVSVTVSGAAKGLAAGAAVSESGAEADADATGVSGGADDDTLVNQGSISTDVASRADSLSVSASAGFVSQGATLQAALSDSRSDALATSTGLAGGEGDDTITQLEGGDIDLRSHAEAETVAVSVSLSGSATGLAAGAALSDSSGNAEAVATGIDGGAGIDTLTNWDSISTDVSSTTHATSVSANLTVAKTGVAIGAALSDANAASVSRATGIDGGADDDALTNHGEIELDATADGLAASVGVAVSATVEGGGVAAALSSSRTTAEVLASGLEGAAGQDTLVNTGDIRIGSDPFGEGFDPDADVMAESEAISVSVTVAGSAAGVAGGAALSDSSTVASVHSRGMAGGSGDDTILSGPAGDGEEEVANELQVYASSVADVTSASANLSVAGGGVAAGAALARARADSDASAIGIAGGVNDESEASEESDDDWIGNESRIEAAAISEATSRAIGITIAANGSGAALGAALTDGSAGAVAEAAGIDGGAGADRIENSEQITATSRAESETLAASFSISLVAKGIAAGGSLSKTESTADAVATAIEGGTGADQIVNAAGLGAEAEADADAVAVSVSISGALTGVAAGAAAADASAQASSRATGIASDASGREDEEPDTSAMAYILSDASVDEEGVLRFEEPTHTIAADAESDADAESVGISGSGSIGMALGAAAADSSATAEADAYGIHGGVEDEIIASGSTINATSVAQAHAGSSSVAASGSIGVAGGSAVANAAGHAAAVTAGIHGGGGDDTIANAGQIDATATVVADADSAGTKVSVALGASGGQAVSDSSVTGSASATGIGGGTGDDEIRNSGPLTAGSSSTATATSDSLSVDFTLGVADSSSESQASALAETLSTGIDGGSGRDTIETENEITVTSISKATGTSNSKNIGIVPIGASLQQASADGSSTAHAAAQGIAGGEGDDTITAAGIIEVSAESDGTGTARSESAGYTIFGGSSSAAASDASTEVLSSGTGIAGGAGIDVIRNEESLTVIATSTANASAESFARSWAFIGSAKTKSAADTSASLGSEATGIDGGAEDDEITNRGALAVHSDSDGTVVTRSNSVSSVSFAGNASAKSAADASANAASTATGIAGGEGQDAITNEEWIDVVSEADLEVTVESMSVASASFFGSSSAQATSDASSTVSAAATGIAGGSDDDVITSSGSLRAAASATTIFSQKTVSIADTTQAHASNDVSGEVSATGLAGGDGNDTLTGEGLIFVETVGDLEVKSLTVSSNGPATSDARTLSITRAAGMDGGEDDDTLSNRETVFVKARPHIKTGSRNYGSNLEGRTGLSMTAEARGIAGGAGDDTITNAGEVVVLVGRPETSMNLTDDLSSGARSFTDASLVGTEEEDLVGRWIQFSPEEGPGFVGQVLAFDSETGEVTLVDPLEQDLVAQSPYLVFDFGDESPDIEAVEINVGGRVFVDASRSASIHAAGIVGGEGEDEIDNTGSVQVRASNEIKIGNYTVGNIDANLSTLSEVSAVGITGNATVTNERLIDVEAGARVDSTGFTWNYGGSSQVEGRAEASAAGVRGGDLADVLLNRGRIATRSSAEVESSQGSVSLGATQSLAFASSSDSAGASLGAGDDEVHNSGDARFEVSASASGEVEGVVETLPDDWFFGIWYRSAGKASQATHHAGASASGLELGDGADMAWNEGALEVLSESLADATATAVIPGLEIPVRIVDADARATSSTAGIRARAGEERVLNQGAIAVESRAVAASQATGSEVVGGDDLSKVGRVVPPGPNDIVAFVDETTIGAQTDLVGKRIRFPASGFPDFVTSVAGFDPATGQITLEAGPSSGSISGGDAYTLSLASQDAGAGSSSFVDGTRQGEDPDDFVGQWIRFEGMDFATRVRDFDPGTGRFLLDDALPASLATDEIYTLSSSKNGESGASANAFAHGIWLGSGNAVVENESTLAVRAFANAATEVEARRGTAGVGVQGAAEGWGVETGDGDDRILNLGVISVESDVVAQAVRNGSADESNTTRLSAARGVETGTGNDEVVNAGTILAVARTTDARSQLSAVAIVSGPDAAPLAEDDDLVVNQGEGLIAAVTSVVEELEAEGWEPLLDPDDIEAEIAAGTPDVAIRTGAGRDTVALRDASRVVGRIELGDDDDTLLLGGTASVQGVVDAGTGSDAIRIEDTGSFRLQQVDALEQVLVDRGSLQVDSDLVLDVTAAISLPGVAAGNGDPPPSEEPSPTFRSEIYDGGYGKLVVNGSAQLLGPTRSEVIATPRIYEDEILELFEADDIVGDFAAEVLPADSALVTFGSDYVRGPGPDLYRVLVEVEPFESVAQGALQESVARYLSVVAPVASPGLTQWIGSFQLLAPDADFDTAFASLSPEQYDASTLTGLDTQRQYMRGLNRRMDTLRARRRLGEEPQALASVQLAMVGSSESIMALAASVRPVRSGATASERKGRYGVWLGAMGQHGDQDPSDGFSAFDYNMAGGSLGVDRSFGDEFIGGLNVGYTYSDIAQEAGRGSGEINAIQASLYGTWFRDQAYVDWVLGYARQGYDNRRNVAVAPMSQTAISEHDANVFGAALGGGYRFDVAGFGLRPFASFSYLLLDEEGFRESGTAGANLVVEPRTTNSLVSELGLRAARTVDLGKSKLVPYLSAAWKYDYEIDDRTIVSGFDGAPGTAFPLDGRTLDQNAAMVGAGLMWFRGGWSVSLEYLGEFRGDYTANGLFGRVGMSF